MDMRNQLMRRCGFTLLVVYGLWAGIGELWAQQRGGATPSRGSSGASRSSTSRAPTSRGSTAGRTGTGSSAYGSATAIGEATVSSDPDTRQLVVITDDETFQHISQVVSNLDRPKPQVLIKVVFLELTHNNSSDIGIEGSYNRNFGNSWISGIKTNFAVDSTGKIVPTGFANVLTNATTIGQTVFGLGAAGANPIPPGAGLYQVLGQDYQVTLRAIAQAGKLELLSRPSILARNNQQATINLGQQIPLVTNTRFDTFGNQINTVSYQSVGIILRVTPFINANGLVEMIVSPEISSLAARSEWVPVSSGAGGATAAPVINSRSADTVVVVPDGQTVVIGGLMQSSKQESESKIPLLGDIPLLGNLFKSKSKADAKTELIIFLTPKIVEEPRQLASLTTVEKASSPAYQGMSENDLSQFLDSLPVKGEAPAKKKTRK